MNYKHKLSAPFTGHITVAALPVRQRTKAAKDLFGVKDVDEDVAGQLDVADAFFELVEKQFRDMEVVVEIDGNQEKVKDLEEFSCYAAGAAVLSEIGLILVQGIPLGNSQSPSGSNAPLYGSGESTPSLTAATAPPSTSETMTGTG